MKYLPWLVLTLGLALTFFLKQQILEAAHRELHIQFERQSDELTRQLEQRLENQMMVLRGIAGFFAGSSHITQDQFRTYIDTQRIEKNSPGVLSIGFAAAFRPENKNSHIREWKKTLGPRYTVWPDSQQDLHTAIVFRAPINNGAGVMFGYDMYTDSSRRTAMELARDLHISVVSNKLTLKSSKSEEGQDGFQIYHPIYQRGSPSTTIAERRKNIIGWAYMPIVMNDFLASILETYGDGLEITIYLAKEPLPAALITSPSRDPGRLSDHSTPLEYKKLLELGNHPWLIHVQPSPSFTTKLDTKPVIMVQIAGGLISLLLFLYLRTLSLSHDRVKEHAAKLTRELSESEHRWHFAVEGQGDGLWDWNVQNNTVYFSPGWKKMLGYAENDIGNQVDEWDKRVHPDDKQRVYDALQPFILGRASSYVSEHRLRCKDGSWKWVLDRGMVVSQATDGHALHIIGTHTDISARKMIESRVERVTQLYATLSQVNQAIVRCKDERKLFGEICQIVVQQGGMHMAWIGILESSERTIRTAASAGMDASYEKTLLISTNPDDPNGGFPAAAAILDNQPIWCQDAMNDPGMAHWRHRAVEGGWQSVGALPLHKNHTVVGAFAVYATEANAFDENACGLLMEIAQDISAALENYARETERSKTEAALLESEARYSTLFTENSVVMLLIEPSNGRIVNANKQASLFYGWDIDTLRTMHIHDINIMGQTLITPEMMSALQENKKHFFFKHRCADGCIREVEVFSGPVEIGGQTLILSSIHDISERRKAEQALQNSEQQNTTILNSLMEHIALLDANANIVTVNDAWLRFAGANGLPRSADEWTKVNYLDICGAALNGPAGDDAAKAIAGIKSVLSGEEIYFEMEYPCHSENEQRWFVMRVSRLQGAVKGAVVAHENITHRKLAELQIRASHIRMAELSAELIDAQENERKNLARELHDEMGQRFTALNMNLYRLRRMPPDEHSDTVWHSINTEVTSLIARVRSMSGSLRPPTLDHLGLEASIQHLLQEHFTNTDINYELEYAGLPRKLPAQVEITVYRIIQEAITNIVRHANASRVVVEINGGDDADELELVIRDNGKGFDTLKLDNPVRISYGLTGMGERVKLLGGSLKVTSTTITGTRITATLPLKR